MSSFMKTYESIENLYKILEKTLGKEVAKKTVSRVIDLIEKEFEEKGTAPTQENLAHRISQYTSDFEQVSRHHVQ